MGCCTCGPRVALALGLHLVECHVVFYLPPLALPVRVVREEDVDGRKGAEDHDRGDDDDEYRCFHFSFVLVGVGWVPRWLGEGLIVVRRVERIVGVKMKMKGV